MILGPERPFEIVDMVAFDQGTVDGGKIHAIHPDRVDVVAQHLYPGTAVDGQGPAPQGKDVVLQRKPPGAAHHQRRCRREPHVIGCAFGGQIAVKHRIADGDVGAAQYLERPVDPFFVGAIVTGGKGIVEHQTIHYQTHGTLDLHPGQNRRVGWILRPDGDRFPPGFAVRCGFQIGGTIGAGCQHQGVAGIRTGQRCPQLCRGGNHQFATGNRCGSDHPDAKAKGSKRCNQRQSIKCLAHQRHHRNDPLEPAPLAGKIGATLGIRGQIIPSRTWLYRGVRENGPKSNAPHRDVITSGRRPRVRGAPDGLADRVSGAVRSGPQAG